MNEEQWQSIQPLVIESTTGLLESCGLRIERTGEWMNDETIGEGLATSIGFSGDQIQGSLLVCAPLALLQRAYPPLKSTLALEDLRDWVGELSNQLLGRIKLQFLQRGIAFYLSTPSVMSGRELRGLLPEGAGRLSFSCAEGTFCVAFAAVLAPGVAVPAAGPVLDESPAVEGDVLLF